MMLLFDSPYRKNLWHLETKLGITTNAMVWEPLPPDRQQSAFRFRRNVASPV